MCDIENCDSKDDIKDVMDEKLSKEKMTNSVGSALNDDTPTVDDSGVVLSDGDLIDSMISSTGFEEVEKPIPDLLIPAAAKNVLSKSDIENNNLSGVNDDLNTADNMMSSIHSTFDTDVVYRKKCKKLTKSAPKKRVSFHEDILNSTRTDNIHIEHGFITYKGKSKQNSRYSWCSEYNNEELDSYVDNSEDNAHHVYRNACSEVLDYGQTELHDDEDAKVHAKDDKSGVFEYPKFYQCQCSSSSSIDSGSSSENNSKSSDNNDNYQQQKSSSCDCIGSTENIEIGRGSFFFSEPNIRKSVWSKEKKPKSSCLKKSKVTSPPTPHPHDCEQKKIDSNVKKFNIHKISKRAIKDNAGKMIIGSLKDIFGISLPERGVPEGSEDNPEECFPRESQPPPPPQPTKRDDFSFLQKVGLFSKPDPTKMQTLSKSLDGGLTKQRKNQFVHDVDNQLRGVDDEDLFASSSTSSSRKNSLKTDDSSVEEKEADEELTISGQNTRNKFIINCESTVFEHTGTIEIPELVSSLEENQLTRKLSSIMNSISGNKSNQPNSSENDEEIRCEAEGKDDFSPISDKNSSIISELSCETISTTASTMSNKKLPKQHLSSSSPMRKKRDRMSPDLFSFNNIVPSPRKLLADNFSDILTVTKEEDDDAPIASTSSTLDNKDDIVIVDYADIKNDFENNSFSNNYYLKLPSIMTTSTSSTSSKTSLINRFLRNVTQKKILDASIKRNNFFQSKLKNEKKLFGGDLYVKAKPKDESLIQSLNWEIDMEIEMGMELDVDEANVKDNRLSVCSAGSFDFDANDGIGELRTDLFDVRELKIFRDHNEILMKAFKLFTGYSNDGNISAVLVFLTDKTIYVVGLVRNKLANKFVLPYAELDVILMGPMGNTVLLSNGARDMQQVMLTCGPYPAEKLISSLEMCSRRGGFNLPAVGELTLDHFAPLQAFVCNNSSVGKTDAWKYYSIVSIPAGILGAEEEPLGPCLQGFFMHRNVSHSGVVQKWSAGYFMLKAGVLYLFNDSTQKIPSWAVSLPNECQGAKRCITSNRPHCFEILLRSGSLQIATPDEFVASDWLQSVIQASNSLNFEMEERQKILGCTLIMTENHLITLREDFSSPLRRVNPQNPIIMPSTSNSSCKENIDNLNLQRKMSNSTILDTVSEVSSIRSTPSTPSRGCRSLSSSTTPTKQPKTTSRKQNFDESASHTNMSSFYGKNSGIEVLMCASIEELISVRTSNCENSWWCLLEFSCQEVRENFDDLVLLFSTASELQRFLTMLENLWHTKMNETFPMAKDDEECPQMEHCEKLFLELKNSWLPLLDQLPPLK